MGPRRTAAAVEHAVGMAVLAGRYRAQETNIPYLLAIGEERGVGRLDTWLAQVRRHQQVSDLEIAFVNGIGFAVIDVVAVEVVALVRHPSRPGKAIRIDRVDEKRRGSRR